MTPSSSGTARPTVLVVDDEPGLADLYAAYLDGSYTVKTASSGKEALAIMDHDVDVVLLDRRMPGLSGDEVLSELRDRGFDQPMALLTAVDPTGDIVGMQIDDYLVKPIDDDELRVTVETLTRYGTYDEAVRVYFAATSKKAALEASLSEQELAASEAYSQLEQEVRDAKARADDALTEMKADDAFAGFREP